MLSYLYNKSILLIREIIQIAAKSLNTFKSLKKNSTFSCFQQKYLRKNMRSHFPIRNCYLQLKGFINVPINKDIEKENTNFPWCKNARPGMNQGIDPLNRCSKIRSASIRFYAAESECDQRGGSPRAEIKLLRVGRGSSAPLMCTNELFLCLNSTPLSRVFKCP